MPSIPRLVWRGDVFYFRMAVPRRLVSQLQRSEVKVSLQTTDPLAAKVRVRLLSNALDVLFREAESMSHISIPTINERIRGYFQECLNRSLEHTQLLPMDPACDVGAEIAGLRESVEAMRKQIQAQTFSHSVVEAATSLVDPTSSGHAQSDPEAFQYACNTVLRAKIENARILAAQLAGRYDDALPRDPLFLGMQATGLPPIDQTDEVADPNGVTLRVLGQRYMTYKRREKVADKTEADVNRVLGLAFEVIGADRRVRSITTEHIQAYRELLASLPPNYMKGAANQGLSATKAAEANSGGPVLSIQTQEKYLRFFKAVLHWGVDEGYLGKQPGEKIKVAGAKKLKSAEQRLPYSQDQLKFIFKSPLFTGHQSNTTRTKVGNVLCRDGYFWIPLIALYSGLRLGEIVQLLTVDIEQEGGITYFNITKSEGDGKKVKTAASF